MNLAGKILYQKRRFMIGWALGLAAISLLMMLFFPALQKSDIGQLFTNMSPSLQKVLGAQDSFSTADKYIAGELFSLRLPLLLIVMNIILFSSLLVADERRGLLQTELSLPYSRRGLLAGRLLAVLVIELVAALGMIAGVILGLLIINQSADMVQLLRHSLGCLLIALDFGLIVWLIGGGLGKRGAATGAATGIAFISYLISSLVPIADFLKPYEKASLFHYYQNPSPVSPAHLLVFVGVGAVLILGGLAAFSRRDLQ